LSSLDRTIIVNKISVIIITKNEERNIRACLESVKWADEIVIVDDGSIDRTIEIEKEFTDKIFIKEWQGFGAARNFAISQCTNEWILCLDADERITPELKDEIKDAVLRVPVDVKAMSMPRRANFLGSWINHCGWYPGRITRLFRRNTGSYSDDLVHEKISINGKTIELKSDILHYTDPTLEHYFEKFNRYTSLAAQGLNVENKRFQLMKLIVNPIWIFFRMYILRLGFLDGIPGLILCILSANYVFTKYAKHWEYSKNEKRVIK
jgi:glycosyltransferase involved in cell wall biosynthesis